MSVSGLLSRLLVSFQTPELSFFSCLQSFISGLQTSFYTHKSFLFSGLLCFLFLVSRLLSRHKNFILSGLQDFIWSIDFLLATGLYFFWPPRLHFWSPVYFLFYSVSCMASFPDLVLKIMFRKLGKYAMC